MLQPIQPTPCDEFVQKAIEDIQTETVLPDGRKLRTVFWCGTLFVALQLVNGTWKLFLFPAWLVVKMIADYLKRQPTSQDDLAKYVDDNIEASTSFDRVTTVMPWVQPSPLGLLDDPIERKPVELRSYG